MPDDDLDIRATADRIEQLFAANRPFEALQLLEHRREREPAAVQEALDRYVAHDAAARLAGLRQDPGFRRSAATLERLASASGPPRFPSSAEIQALSPAQAYDVYASIVSARGNDAAREALGQVDERVILGLRRENSTLQSIDAPGTGTGVYNDRLVVLWKDRDGGRHVYAAQHANTEPTAQYDHHAGSDGRRPFADGGRAPALAASPGFEAIHPRKIEGADNNRDGMRDLGRLREGTIEMRAATHPRAGHAPDAALRPSNAAVDAPAARGSVQRDTNGDGWFDHRDINGTADLDVSFKIHRGSMSNTDSAGCQTVRSDEYDGFMREVRGSSSQTRWQYVLTETSEPPVHTAPTRRDAGRHAPEQHTVNPRQQARPPHAPPDATPPPSAARPPRADGPDRPGHPHHAMLQDIRRELRDINARLGLAYDERSECLSRSLLAQCVAPDGRDGYGLPLTRVDRVVIGTDGRHAFAVQGDPAEPGHRIAMVDVGRALATPPEQSDRRIADASQDTAAALRESAPQRDAEHSPQAHAASRRMPT